MIGAGDVTEVKSGPAFNKVANSTLVALVRRNAEKAKDYASRHNVPYWYCDAAAMLCREDINAVYIATPPSSHKQYALAALQAGKDIYLGKPMALNAAESREILQAADKYGRRVCLAHYRRELPCFKKVKELIDSGSIGDIQYVRSELLQPEASGIIAKADEDWRTNPAISGGGLFHDLAPHQIDLMVHYFGLPVDFSGLACARKPGVADLVSGQMEFQKGSLFQGIWCFTAPRSEARDKCMLLGTRGKIEFSFFSAESVCLSTEEKNESYNFSNPENIQFPMIEKVVKYFSGEGDNPCTGKDGLKVMEIMDTFTAS